MATKRTENGETPNGGVVAELYFFDDEGNSVDEKIGTQIRIRELDSEGNLIFETFGSYGNK